MVERDGSPRRYRTLPANGYPARGADVPSRRLLGDDIRTITGDAHAVSFFTPDGVLAAIERFRVTNLLLVPAMVNMLISHPRITEAGVSSVRWLGYGGSVIPEAVLRRAIAAFPNCRFQQAYGHTELSPIATILGPEYHVLDGLNAGKLTSAGRAAACNEIMIVDPSGAEVPRGTVGSGSAAFPAPF